MRTKRIESLTDEQIARFPEFVKRWTDIGLCTDPADRPRAEAAVRKCYEIAGLPHPKRIVWCGSPLSQGLTRAIAMGLDGKASVEVGKDVWDSVRDSVSASVWASVSDSVRDSVGASVRDSVWASVRDSVWDSVGASVRDSVWASVRDSVWDSVGDSVGDSGYGQHDANWLAFYQYFAEACGLSDETKKLVGLWELGRSANWWLPHQNICWISDRHDHLHRNDAGRLHCETGPALSYRDGWCIWAIGGVRVDEQIVMQPRTQTVEQIRAEQNAEIKRIRIERFGWEQYLTTTKAKVIDRRRNDVECTKEALMHVDDMTVLGCHCTSTGRVYSLEVDSAAKTCEQAQNFLWSGSRLVGHHGRRFNIIGRS